MNFESIQTYPWNGKRMAQAGPVVVEWNRLVSLHLTVCRDFAGVSGVAPGGIGNGIH